MESFLSGVGMVALTLLLIAGGIASVGLRWAAVRSRPKGSYEELYHSDGDPQTKDDHLHARDPRSLLYGRAYGDNYREPVWLRLFVAAATVGVTVFYLVSQSLRGWSELGMNQEPVSPAALIGAIVVFTLAVKVWRYIMTGEELPWTSSSPRRRRFANMPRPNPQPKEAGEKPKPRRKRKFQRQL